VRGSERATIGPSIAIQGDVTGEEDLVIQGRVDGKVDLKQHSVTVGKNGRVRADVYGRTITIEGEVQGNLYGEEQIVVRQSGRVEGNITAPRVTLEDGARFKGSIDMETQKMETQKMETQKGRPAGSAKGDTPPETQPETKPSTGAVGSGGSGTLPGLASDKGDKGSSG
jgi:cytoskeletal protein CcmA (bactofilin family)